jgi:hypothetical protein
MTKALIILLAILAMYALRPAPPSPPRPEWGPGEKARFIERKAFHGIDRELVVRVNGECRFLRGDMWCRL